LQFLAIKSLYPGTDASR